MDNQDSGWVEVPIEEWTSCYPTDHGFEYYYEPARRWEPVSLSLQHLSEAFLKRDGWKVRFRRPEAPKFKEQIPVQTKPACKDCRFSLPYGAYFLCRRYAPGKDGNYSTIDGIHVEGDYWCGEFQSLPKCGK